jgi:hypothetical protein
MSTQKKQTKTAIKAVAKKKAEQKPALVKSENLVLKYTVELSDSNGVLGIVSLNNTITLPDALKKGNLGETKQQVEQLFDLLVRNPLYSHFGKWIDNELQALELQEVMEKAEKNNQQEDEIPKLQIVEEDLEELPPMEDEGIELESEDE